MKASSCSLNFKTTGLCLLTLIKTSLVLSQVPAYFNKIIIYPIKKWHNNTKSTLFFPTLSRLIKRKKEQQIFGKLLQ